MNHSIYRSVLAFSFTVFPVWISSLVYAQANNYRIDFEQSENFTVTGTSTLTDWTVTCNSIGGEPATLTGFSPAGGEIQSVYFYAVVDDMDGGRGETMNDKTKIALKSDQQPRVEFRQTGIAKIIPGGDDWDYSIVMSGDLLIGGITKSITLDLGSVRGEDGEIVITGVQPLTFSELEIEPPSALFGQIVCGDEIQVNISLVLKPISQN